MANSVRLQMIQAIITRLAGNSAALKGFTVPTLSALLGVAIGKHHATYAVLAYFVVVAFGVLDAYYLALERAYRSLYTTAMAEADDAWGLAAPGVNLLATLSAVFSPSVYLF
jgi:hypothetical protein